MLSVAGPVLSLDHAKAAPGGEVERLGVVGEMNHRTGLPPGSIRRFSLLALAESELASVLP